MTITETLTMHAGAAHTVGRDVRALTWEARVACLWEYTMAFARVR